MRKIVFLLMLFAVIIAHAQDNLYGLFSWEKRAKTAVQKSLEGKLELLSWNGLTKDQQDNLMLAGLS